MQWVVAIYGVGPLQNQSKYEQQIYMGEICEI